MKQRRGCLSPVIALAVILPKNFNNKFLNDSKKLNVTREKLEIIIKKEALVLEVGVVSPKEIDKLNILNAHFLQCIEQLIKLIVNSNSY